MIPPASPGGVRLAQGPQALWRAHDIAAGVGAHPAERTVEAAADSSALLEAAAAEDLLVLGAHGGSRAGGIVLGSTASGAAL